MKLGETPCPKCQTVGYLGIAIRWVATPLGEFSLSGGQIKMPARTAPILECDHPLCDYSLVGRFDDDGTHVLFDPA